MSETRCCDSLSFDGRLYILYKQLSSVLQLREDSCEKNCYVYKTWVFVDAPGEINVLIVIDLKIIGIKCFNGRPTNPTYQLIY